MTGRTRIFTIVVGFGLFAALVLVWLGKSGPVTDEIAEAPTAATLPVETTNASRSTFFRKRPATPPRAVAETLTTLTNALPSPVSSGKTDLIVDWEDAIDEVLRSEGKPEEVGRKLLALLPRLPEAGQVDAIQHLANLLADEDYPQLTAWLTDPKTPESVREELMADLLNRTNAVKLPALLAVARTPNHPQAEEARDFLELYLDEDYGEDWARWESAMIEWLRENPDWAVCGNHCAARRRGVRLLPGTEPERERQSGAEVAIERGKQIEPMGLSSMTGKTRSFTIMVGLGLFAVLVFVWLGTIANSEEEQL